MNKQFPSWIPSRVWLIQEAFATNVALWLDSYYTLEVMLQKKFVSIYLPNAWWHGQFDLQQWSISIDLIKFAISPTVDEAELQAPKEHYTHYVAMIMGVMEIGKPGPA